MAWLALGRNVDKSSVSGNRCGRLLVRAATSAHLCSQRGHSLTTESSVAQPCCEGQSHTHVLPWLKHGGMMHFADGASVFIAWPEMIGVIRGTGAFVCPMRSVRKGERAVCEEGREQCV